MLLTVLGKSPSWQDAGGACSSYLIEGGGVVVLVDCGNGVFSKLRRFRDYTKVDAVVLTHLHADHFLDLVPYAYALTYAPRQQPVPVDRWPGTDAPARPRLVAPAGAAEVFRRVTGAWGPDDLITNAFRIEEHDGDAAVEIGGLRVEFAEVPHFTKTYACRFTAGADGGTIVVGADSGPSDALVELARGADLMIVESTLPRPERDGRRGHLTPREAGEHGARAGAARLVLTHLSDELDPLWARSEARAGFGGPVEIAREGTLYRV